MVKYKKLKNILKNLKPLFPEVENINYLELSKNMEYINELLNKIKKIVLLSKNKKEILDKISNLRDEKNNKIFNNKEIKYISKKIVMLL